MAEKINSKDLGEIIDSMGGIEEFHRRMEQHKKDNKYFDTYHQELLKAYPEEWCAVYNEAVVEHNKDFMNLLERMDKETRGNAVIQYVTARRIPLIL